MNINIRPAQLSDVESIFIVRTSVAENHLSREEMQEMGITETTVKVHRSNMMRKINVTSLAELCRMVDKLSGLTDTGGRV